jgi:hypothetical protein
MDAIATLPILGKIMRAIYMPYGSASDPEQIAVGVASILPAPVRVFRVRSDWVTPEEGRTLVSALTGSSAVVLFGSSNSKLLRALGHYWPDYVEYAAHSSMTIVRHVELTPSHTPQALATVYLLFPELTPEHRSDRPGVLQNSKAQMQGHLFPDIYAALWRMEHVFQPDTFFRGQFRCEWGLECTLLRPPNGAETLDVGELTRRAHLTEFFIDELKRREIELFGGPMDDDSLLAIAQHFGLPKPLLDFTRSVKIAAFFATLSAQDLKSDDPAIGVIFYNSAPLERQLDLTDHPQARGLHKLAGVRIGSLHVVEPNLPDADDRIRRQQGVFIAGYRARDFQAVSIDRIYFKQQPGVIFEDPKAGVTRARLLPENTALSTIAEEVKKKFPLVPILPNALLRRTTISDTSVIGSAGAHLYWHLRFGQQFLRQVRQQAQQTGTEPLAQALEAAVSQYFAMAHVEAGISEVPDHESEGLLLEPIRKAITALEAAAGLAEDDLWRLLVKQLPKGFESGGSIHVDVPENWPASGRIALSCAMFCMAWEHLRQVPGLRAQELVQSATMHLHR